MFIKLNNTSQWKTNLMVGLRKVFGDKVIDDLHKRVCINRYRRANLIFVHIPRAAGSSIAKATIGQRAGHYTVSELRNEMGNKEFDSFFKFSVVRNPYDRLVSSYHYAKQGGGTHGGIKHNSIYNSSKFETFERFVLEWLVNQDISKLDYVFQPQNRFLYHGDELLVDFVGRIEKMEDVEDKLSTVLKKKISIGKRNKSKRRNDYKTYYPNDVHNAVSKIYKKDIELFGYSL